MKIRRHSINYNFIGDTETGLTFRWGRYFENNPSCAPWPELADISISNHCSKGCSYCYRDSKPNRSFINISNYEFILKQLKHPKWNNVFQIAIGGGEPTEHPDFAEILALTKKYQIIPNYTTNGLNLNNKILKATKKFCGAVAMSIDMPIKHEDIKKIKLLTDYKIKTNIHVLLSDKTIDSAIAILKGKHDRKLSKLNAVVFLTYKPFGRATKLDVLVFNEKLTKFLKLINNPKTKIRLGFDACFVPLLLRYTKIDSKYIDSCECGFFSIYIDEKMNVKPCSFTNNDKFTFNLKSFSFKEIWGKKLSNYRKLSSKSKKCINCAMTNVCRGGCLFFPEINLCK